MPKELHCVYTSQHLVTFKHLLDVVLILYEVKKIDKNTSGIKDNLLSLKRVPKTGSSYTCSLM